MRGLHIVDVSDPQNPIEAGIWETTGLIYDVAVRDVYAYVADPMLGLHVIDVSDPQDPAEVNLLNTLNAQRLKVHGDYLYLYSNLLLIYDLADPELPVSVATYDAPEEGQEGAVVDIEFAGNYAYIVGGSWFRVLDISTPAAPVEVGFIETSGSANEVVLSGNRAYVVEERDDLEIFDITDPSELATLGLHDIDSHNESDIMDIAASGDFVFISEKSHTLQVYNVSDPSNVQLVGWHDTEWDARDVVADENIVYLNYQFGIEIYDVSAALPTDNTDFTGPEQFYLSPVYPNPFNNTTRITFGSPYATYGRVVVYDMLGREMVTLYDGKLVNETYQVTFDARNLSSGTYFVRFETPAFSATQKAVLLK